MADINKFSEQLIDVSERFADAVDGAQGHGPRKSGLGARWLILPAAGAAAYALATSGSSLARQPGERGHRRRTEVVRNQPQPGAKRSPSPQAEPASKEDNGLKVDATTGRT